VVIRSKAIATIARSVATEEEGKGRIVTDAHVRIRFDRTILRPIPGFLVIPLLGKFAGLLTLIPGKFETVVHRCLDKFVPDILLPPADRW